MNQSVRQSIIQRIGTRHVVLISLYGLTNVMEEIDNESMYKDGLEEIGSSDVSCWVKNIIDRLQRYHKPLGDNETVDVVGIRDLFI